MSKHLVDDDILFASNSTPLAIEYATDVAHYGLHALDLLATVSTDSIYAAIYDPQWRAVLDKLDYGNEGARQKGRVALAQQSDNDITAIGIELARVIRPSGHVLMWADKTNVCSGAAPAFFGDALQIVDLICWSNPSAFGMGYRSRHRAGYVIVLQKPPIRAKGCWTRKDIPDVWDEPLKRGDKSHPHQKPQLLQQALIEIYGAGRRHRVGRYCRQFQHNESGARGRPQVSRLRNPL